MEKRSRRFDFAIRAVLLIAVIVIFGEVFVRQGLPNNVSDEELKALKPQMSLEEVRQTLGSPNEVFGEGGDEIWVYGFSDTAGVKFKNGRLIETERNP
ncbi:MAG: outer membrane protein assembly factor BamE [Planctomycetia bacterium]|nr:outer membrane protein assembly factor BamE [Planctomycetia bacterium]